MRKLMLLAMAVMAVLALGAGGSTLTATGFVPSACADGIDNDGDGLIDVASDPGCEGFDDASEDLGFQPGGGSGSGGGGSSVQPTPLGAYDPNTVVDTTCCGRVSPNPQAPIKVSPPAANPSPPASSPPAQTPAPNPPEAIDFGTRDCTDNRDNDGDGLTDFPNDPGCNSPYDRSE